MTKREASQPEIDWAAFGRAVMSPARPHLEEAVGVAREVVEERWRSLRGRSRMSAAARTEALTDPAVVSDVCETLASRLDAHWLLDGARSFLPYVRIDRIDYNPNRLPRPSDTPRQLSDTPYEVELVAALAAGDPRDIGTVEALAMEAANAVIPWGIRMPSRVAWVLLSSGWPEERVTWHDIWGLISLPAWWVDGFMDLSSYPPDTIRDNIMSESVILRRGQSSKNSPRLNALESAAIDARNWWRWNEVARLGGVVQDHNYSFGYPRLLIGTPMRNLQNPHDAILRAWGLGYAIVDIRGDVVVVGVPAAGDPISAPSWGALRSLQMKRYGAIAAPTDGTTRRA